MIIVNLAQRQEDGIKALEAYDGGDFTFKFVSKQGIRLKFEVTGGDDKTAADVAKKYLKEQPWAGALFFNVTPG